MQNELLKMYEFDAKFLISRMKDKGFLMNHFIKKIYITNYFRSKSCQNIFLLKVLYSLKFTTGEIYGILIKRLQEILRFPVSIWLFSINHAS